MQGATASHPVDGDLSPYITACSPDYPFVRLGLLGCNLDTSMLGRYTIRFSIKDMATGITATAARTVVVHAICAEDEIVCEDLHCGSGGLCLASEALVIPRNTPPVLRLRKDDDARVFVKRGVKYEVCRAPGAGSDVDGGASLVCQGVPEAFDAEDGDLSENVLACPPDKCLPFGCPGHELRRKGVSFSEVIPGERLIGHV
jgi:hypothetical protein